MGTRVELQALLEELLGSGNVYFKAPPNNQMAYPCIVYERDNARTQFAGNQPYSFTWRYQLTLIGVHPDSLVLDKVARLPMCQFNKHFVVGKQSHDVFVLYF